MEDPSQADEVWEHGENICPGFVYKYCKCSKKGGGATRFKQHLASRENNVKHCSCILPNVHDYFLCDLDRTTDRKKSKQKERLLREEVATEGNVVHDIDSEDKELQCALHASREEAQFQRVARERGGGGNISTGVVHLKNKVACLEGCRGQAHKGKKALPCKQGLTRAHSHRRVNMQKLILVRLGLNFSTPKLSPV
jgi:hypothetical protein